MSVRPCIVHGCPRYALDGVARCREHENANVRERWARGLTGRRGTRGIARLRQRVIRRQRERCADCGDPGPLQVHHVDGNAHNQAPENLVALCIACHLARR